MIKGTVKWFNDVKGFGFIQGADQDYFVHYREIQSDGFKKLTAGDRVEFLSQTSPKGAMATQVRKIQSE
jgi:CspA family cold shock protein